MNDDTPIETSEAEARPWKPSDGYTESPAASASTTHAMVCHAPGERCLGCAHYRGESPVCEHAAQQGEAVAPDDEADRPTLRGCIETIKQAHDESLEGEHASARVVLRDVVADLEQIAAQPAAAPQPVAQGERQFAEWLNARRDCRVSEVFHDVCGHYRTALAAAPAGVAGEPVAPEDWRDTIQGAIDELPYAHHLIPRLALLLNTAPPARQALTDEQIRALLLQGGYGNGLARFTMIVRSIERTHGIGGKGETDHG